MTRGSRSAIGPLSPNSVNQPHYIVRHEFAHPDRVTNALVREPLQLSKLWTAAPRPGSLDAA